MIAIPDRLRTLVTTQLTRHDGTLQIEIPKEAIEQPTVAPGEVYQIAVIETETAGSPGKHHAASSTSDTRAPPTTQGSSKPPVEEGEIRTVTIETLGEHGDGITRVERGFVVIVSDAKPDDEVTIEIETVKSNVAFASIVEQTE